MFTQGLQYRIMAEIQWGETKRKRCGARVRAETPSLRPLSNTPAKCVAPGWGGCVVIE
jgi:hypothetical protein